jgi:hypothetical protein
LVFPPLPQQQQPLAPSFFHLFFFFPPQWPWLCLTLVVNHHAISWSLFCPWLYKGTVSHWRCVWH